jgi:hypothetical protein
VQVDRGSSNHEAKCPESDRGSGHSFYLLWQGVEKANRQESIETLFLYGNLESDFFLATLPSPKDLSSGAVHFLAVKPDFHQTDSPLAYHVLAGARCTVSSLLNKAYQRSRHHRIGVLDH